MVIAWLITAYNKLDVLKHIIDKIIDKSNNKDIILIHYDKKSPKKELKELKEYYKGNSQINIYSKFKVKWGHISSIKVDKLLANKLLNLQQHFDYVINSTGSTYFGDTYNNLQKFLTINYGKSFCMLDTNEAINLDTSSEQSKTIYNRHFGYIDTNKVGGGLNKIRYFIKTKILRKPKSTFKIKKINTFKLLYKGAVHNIIFGEHYKKIIQSKEFNKFFNEICDERLILTDEILFNTVLCNLIKPENLSTNYTFLYTDWTNCDGSPHFLYQDKLEEYFKNHNLCFFIRKIPDIESLKYIDSIIDN